MRVASSKSLCKSNRYLKRWCKENGTMLRYLDKSTTLALFRAFF